MLMPRGYAAKTLEIEPPSAKLPRVWHVAVSASGRRVLAAGHLMETGDHFLNLWDTSDGRRRSTVIEGWKRVQSVSISGNGQLCAAVFTNELEDADKWHSVVWSVADSKLTQEHAEGRQ
jgi:urease accessory protein UreH